VIALLSWSAPRAALAADPYEDGCPRDIQGSWVCENVDAGVDEGVALSRLEVTMDTSNGVRSFDFSDDRHDLHLLDGQEHQMPHNGSQDGGLRQMRATRCENGAILGHTRFRDSHDTVISEWDGSVRFENDMLYTGGVWVEPGRQCRRQFSFFLNPASSTPNRLAHPDLYPGYRHLPGNLPLMKAGPGLRLIMPKKVQFPGLTQLDLEKDSIPGWGGNISTYVFIQGHEVVTSAYGMDPRDDFGALDPSKPFCVVSLGYNINFLHATGERTRRVDEINLPHSGENATYLTYDSDSFVWNGGRALRVRGRPAQFWSDYTVESSHGPLKAEKVGLDLLTDREAVGERAPRSGSIACGKLGTPGDQFAVSDFEEATGHLIEVWGK
jgi:hypothetical protein